MKRKLSPLPSEAGECSSSGSRRPGHPHSTPWSCERAKTKLTTHVMQDSTLCPRQYLHAPLLCRVTLCRVSHQPAKYGVKNRKRVSCNSFILKRGHWYTVYDTFLSTLQKAARNKDQMRRYCGLRWYVSQCVRVCVFFQFILEVKFVGCTSRGHTGSHPPSLCGG